MPIFKTVRRVIQSILEAKIKTGFHSFAQHKETWDENEIKRDALMGSQGAEN